MIGHVLSHLFFLKISGWRSDSYSQALLGRGLDPFRSASDVTERISEVDRSPVLFEDFSKPPTASGDCHVEMFTSGRY